MASEGRGGPVRRTAARVATASRWLNRNLPWMIGVIVAVAAAVALVTEVAGAITGADASVVVQPVEAATLEGLASADLPAGTELSVDGWTEGLRFHVAEVSLPLRLLASAGTVTGALLIAIGGLLAASIARHLLAGRPFVRQVRSAMLGLVLVFLAGSFLPAAVESVASTVFLESTGAIERSIGLFAPVWMRFSVGAVLAAVFLGILSQAFWHGQRLERDVEGLV